MADLLYLVRFSFVALDLQVQDLLDPGSRENVVTSSDAFVRSLAPKAIAEGRQKVRSRRPCRAALDQEFSPMIGMLPCRFHDQG
jgi:hypothetical protein